MQFSKLHCTAIHTKEIEKETKSNAFSAGCLASESTNDNEAHFRLRSLGVLTKKPIEKLCLWQMNYCALITKSYL